MPNGPVEVEANSTIVIRIKINRDIYRTIVQHGFVTVSTRGYIIGDFPSPTDLFVNFGSRCRGVDDERGEMSFLYASVPLRISLRTAQSFVIIRARCA
jgi:hypothetical protein